MEENTHPRPIQVLLSASRSHRGRNMSAESHQLSGAQRRTVRTKSGSVLDIPLAVREFYKRGAGGIMYIRVDARPIFASTIHNP